MQGKTTTAAPERDLNRLSSSVQWQMRMDEAYAEYVSHIVDVVSARASPLRAIRPQE